MGCDIDRPVFGFFLYLFKVACVINIYPMQERCSENNGIGKTVDTIILWHHSHPKNYHQQVGKSLPQVPTFHSKYRQCSIQSLHRTAQTGLIAFFFNICFFHQQSSGPTLTSGALQDPPNIIFLTTKNHSYYQNNAHHDQP
jgi:hypothetical protein